MKIVFFGTSDFAVPSLEKLRKYHDILAVITKSDKPQGRRLVCAPSPVKIAAKKLNLNVSSIEGVPVSEAASGLKKYGADLFVVIAYGQILPSRILSLPKFYSVGLHASLLPKYRGPSPINWAILKGESHTGLTVFRLNEKMDAGDIIMQKEAEISIADNSETLSVKLANLGANLLVKAADAIQDGKAQLIKQNASEATFTPKLKKEDGRLDWNDPAVNIHNKIRALYGWPGAFSALEGRTIKIWSSTLAAMPEDSGARPGEIVGSEGVGILVACGRDAVKILELQSEGGKRMRASDYIRGHRVPPGARFVN